ncbi:MAG TPA: hypothetical protein VEY33_05165, partial [Gemmatimonadota bacterium]|nr:hypothetical protein [Gemmatimonadota bacterium]
VIPFSGVLRVRDMSVESAVGFHRTFQIIVQGSGVGETSGTLYTFHDSHVFAFNFNFLGAHELTEVTNAFLISNGVATNAMLQLVIHGTRSATGEITVEFEKLTLACRGAH